MPTKKRYNLVFELLLARRLARIGSKYGLNDTDAIRYCVSRVFNEEFGGDRSQAEDGPEGQENTSRSRRR